MEPIKTEGLGKIYFKGLRRQKVVALRELNLSVPEGEIFGFVGPNGAGKSTTIKILCDLIRPTSGRATILGLDVRQPEARRHIGYLPENPSYYSFLTAWELLRFQGAIHHLSPGVIRSRGGELLEMLELGDAAGRPLRTYSKGMVQRFGIAAALILDPQILIFDEPMSGLDPIGRKLVADLMLELRQQGKTIFFSTHILADVEHICDRIGMIVRGRLTYVGRLEEILAGAVERYHLVFRLGDVASQILLSGEQPTLRAGCYHLEVGAADFQETLKSLLAEGAEIVSLEPKRLRLEDIFVSLTRGQPQEQE